MVYATEIPFISSTNGSYEPQLDYDDFVKLATAQLDQDVAPDYGILIMHNQCRYVATDGDILIEYQENSFSGSPWGYWSIRDQHGISGGSTSFSRAIREWMDRWFDRRLDLLDQASQPED